ncbi:MAG: DUF423 domain-containing protein [Candidatus Marinimicrobia bacterium]|nr:hypothetical protein [Candidatus Neomarinimicrobiota bacterium]MDP6297396.1 DUF423 domain-containing protein [Candidatus Neomarinimicrobiota bacterium]MDP7120660.1 DUF423 domain-containing protein [Candidatus Neomarinimicrobiota bacterium]MDP7483049.1 DUF423 domain-containing protein [Candidatus Neomarinimicrobiota bacterium]MDP7528534.1 DUF423 domain-containing protein [Candidatus Neomarinimicrobiota bacterium]
MKPSAWIVTGAVFGFLAVALGAFGAHGLKSKVTADTLSSFETAARYQIYHALALILVGVLANTVSSPLLEWSGRLFATGVVLFSGSIYLMVFTGVTSLGVVTPFGGLCFLAGWAALAVAAYRG